MTEEGDLDRIEHQQRLISAPEQGPPVRDRRQATPHSEGYEQKPRDQPRVRSGTLHWSHPHTPGLQRPDDAGPPQRHTKILPEGEQVLVPNKEANEALLAEVRY